MGLAIGAMDALLWIGMPLAIPPSPAAALIAEATIILLAIAVTTAPLGLSLEKVLRLPLRRSVLLSAIYSAFFVLATAATLIGLLIAMRRR